MRDPAGVVPDPRRFRRDPRRFIGDFGESMHEPAWFGLDPSRGTLELAEIDDEPSRLIDDFPSPVPDPKWVDAAEKRSIDDPRRAAADARSRVGGVRGASPDPGGGILDSARDARAAPD